MQNFFFVIFILFWSTIVLVLDVTFGSAAWKQYQSSHFESVTGTITRSKVKTGHTSKNRPTYSVDLAYRYQIGSQNFIGTRIRLAPRSSNRAYANDLVKNHPVDSHVTVYYDPQNPGTALLDPGVAGGDLFPILFFTPFNAIMLAFWIAIGARLREWIFRPVAGGVKLITDGTAIRVRLPQFAPLWWGVATASALAFVSIFAIGMPTGMWPSMPLAIATIAAVYGSAICVWFWKWQIVMNGVDDLVVDKFNRRLTLPETFDRKTLMTVAVPDIQAIWVEKITHRSSKGAISYTYAPTLYIPKTEKTFEKLADWSDKRKADDFAEWLSKQINVPIESTEPARRVTAGEPRGSS